MSILLKHTFVGSINFSGSCLSKMFSGKFSRSRLRLRSSLDFRSIAMSGRNGPGLTGKKSIFVLDLVDCFRFSPEPGVPWYFLQPHFPPSLPWRFKNLIQTQTTHTNANRAAHTTRAHPTQAQQHEWSPATVHRQRRGGAREGRGIPNWRHAHCGARRQMLCRYAGESLTGVLQFNQRP